MKRAAMLVRKLWRETGEPITLQSKDPIGAINHHAKRYNSTRMSPQLRNNIILYDQFVMWLVNLATLLIFNPQQREMSQPAYQFLISSICSLALSIRHQVVLGQDLGAKILLRSLCEYVDVLTLLIARPNLVAEFQQEDFKKANEFWHRHIKSLRARRALWTSLGVGDEVPIEWKNWREQEDTLLSLAAHPSYVAAVMSVIPFHSADRGDAILEWPAYLGAVTEASIRTLQYTMYSLSLLALLTRFPFGKKGHFEPLVIFDKTDRIHSLVEIGRHVLIGICTFLSGDGRDSPHYECPAPAWFASEDHNA